MPSQASVCLWYVIAFLYICLHMHVYVNAHWHAPVPTSICLSICLYVYMCADAYWYALLLHILHHCLTCSCCCCYIYICHCCDGSWSYVCVAHAHCSIPEPMCVHICMSILSLFCFGPSHNDFVLWLTRFVLFIKLLEQGFSNRKWASVVLKGKRQVNFIPSFRIISFVCLLPISQVEMTQLLKELLPREKIFTNLSFLVHFSEEKKRKKCFHLVPFCRWKKESPHFRNKKSFV